MEKVKNLLRQRSKLIIVVIIILALTLPFVVNQVLKQQDIRQRASESQISFGFEFATASSTVGNNIEFSLTINTSTYDIGAIHAKIKYDPSKLEFVGFTPTQTLVLQNAIANNGVVDITVLNTSETAFTNPQGVYGKLKFKAIAAGNGQITYNQPVEATATGVDDFVPYDPNINPLLYSITEEPSGITVTINEVGTNSITKNGANLTGSITKSTNTTGIYQFSYGTSSDCAGTVVGVTQMTPGTTTYQPSINITGLQAATKYYACLQYQTGNNQNILKSNIVNFTTLNDTSSSTKPTISVGDAQNITKDSVNLSYSVNPNGKLTSITYRYQEGSATSCNSSIPTTTLIGPTGLLNSSAGVTPLTGLRANTLYSYCATATNADGTSYSEIKQFTTLSDTNTNQCPLKNRGDANCDGKVDAQFDFVIWKGEFANPGSGTTADFDGHDGVTALDFVVWKGGYTDSSIPHN